MRYCFFVVLAVLASACAHHQTEPDHTYGFDVVSAANPHDEVGEWHNRVLHQLGQDPAFLAEPTVRAGAVSIDKFFRSEGVFTDFMRVYEEKLADIEEDLLELTPARIEALLQSIDGSPEYIKKIRHVFKLLEEARSNTSRASVQNSINALKRVEDSVIDSSKLESIEKRNILMTSAVARYSLAFWHVQSAGADAPWIETPGVAWYVADAAGALTGLQISAAAFGPWGIIGVAALGSALNSL